MSDDFYRAFEDLHRGDRESIKNRQRVYLPFLLPWKDIDNNGVAIDLGCGRGEWIELLSEKGFEAIGVDLDEGMLQEARLRGLTVKLQDALAALKERESSSSFVISAYHLIEHIEFASLKELILEAYRVLKPGGILILETPNPANLLVASNNFYIDPTHVRPIPLELLEFIVSYYGFERIKKIGLQGWSGLQEEMVLVDVLGGVAPDAAVVAQKNADEAFLNLFDRAFRAPRGFSLSELSNKYEHAQRARLAVLDQKIESLHASLNQEMHDLRGILSSRSWRWTRPFRELWQIGSRIKHSVKSRVGRLRPKQIVKRLLLAPLVYIRSKPERYNNIKRCLQKMGLIEPLKKLRRVIKRDRLGTPSAINFATISVELEGEVAENSSTPYARIVTTLKSEKAVKTDENRL